jgi:hypothetical protein
VKRNDYSRIPVGNGQPNPPWARIRCACPSREARRCYCLRYAPDDTDPKDEVCECACHEVDDDE